MKIEKKKNRIAILGGGPSGLFMYKRFAESTKSDIEITIIERKKQLGAGMPYSLEGANNEHITNVSANEIPLIVTPMSDWILTLPKDNLSKFGIDPNRFNEYKVLPRLLFGQYLSAQFELLKQLAKQNHIETAIHLETNVLDIIDKPELDEVWVKVDNHEVMKFEAVVICTGHNWPITYEGKVPGYFDSPYPPAKLAFHANHSIAIKGSSLTAIDAIRTLARNNGTFIRDSNEKLLFELSDESPDFKIKMHSRSGLLPAVRFHLEDSHLQNDSLLTPEEIEEHRKNNNGFLSLDFVFEKNFKDLFKEKDPKFYNRIKDLTIAEFVDNMMELRERLDPFVLLRAEYAEAEKSIKRHESVYWKEMLAVLSFAMNYPAKYLSAEDMLLLQKVLMPLISIVIAFVPQASCQELLALHDAGILEITSVGSDSKAEVNENSGGIIYHFTDDEGKQREDYYKTFVNCVGQPHLSYSDFPFKSLVTDKTVSPARLKFASSEAGSQALSDGNKDVEEFSDGFYLKVPGLTINDHFQIVDPYGAYNNRIFIMAVPYIGGFNPDYSGLDFCEAASEKIMEIIGK